MGLFDTIWAKCPTENCKGRIEYQSKSGRCLLIDYELSDAPDDVLEGAIGGVRRCDECGTPRELRKVQPRTIQVELN